ncbi:hypothetical protein PYCC9005_005577 [Savitreella phatthalungensis]
MSNKEEQKFGIDKTMMDPKVTDPKATTGPGHVHLTDEQIAGLEKPKSKEELQELAAKLNK